MYDRTGSSRLIRRIRANFVPLWESQILCLGIHIKEVLSFVIDVGTSPVRVM